MCRLLQANLAKIVAHNARNDATYRLGLNAHADLTTDEFRLRYFGAKKASAQRFPRPKGDPFPYGDEVPPPKRDWRAEGKLTPVKDQHVGGAPCGCCYAFGGMAGVEAANTLYTGELTTLSEQEIVSCDELDYGCDGGLVCGDFSNVFEWIIKNGGIDTDADWPYEAKVTACQRRRMKKNRPVTINGHVDVPKHNETALMQSVSHTPTVAAVCCGDYLDQWHLYKSGVMGDSVQCTKPLDHSVLVAGYDTDAETGEAYWLIKNSWGSSWGEGGYMRLKRFQTHRNGQAGLATFPGYPYKNTPNPGQVRQAGGQRDAPYACGMLPPP
ncbi:hypothetical protein CHLNCDRAFT_18068 [Chlorella variabilis]|uniref:Peptidase C1A papain C-terminal domain-containing protein n=1 Tax=Chlorella variabilis TaxID=554065 RepID=E1Z3E6_CHLVA|nr:hypothetical protein CHLNCDRAFT_18068 [Chlorella variabilis]EFN59831.1 hypothetical protein CHLNCDRAFT_18068 [Chlorella variabilis]|eukprot:XP_005851933.1 hypothetical protein CHLNCDRAFT_18068 [Chlorella variabilis]